MKIDPQPKYAKNKDNPWNKILATKEDHIKVYNLNQILQYNFCFLIGRSGSGKTTISKKIAKELNFELHHLDDIRNRVKILATTSAEYYANLEAEIYKIISSASKDKKIIIEGTSILNLNYGWITSQALIMIEKPALLCLIGQISRKYYIEGFSITYSITNSLVCYKRIGERLKKLYKFLDKDNRAPWSEAKKILKNYYTQ